MPTTNSGPPGPRLAGLGSVLDRAITRAGDLLEVLAREQAALTARDLAALRATVEEKSHLVEELEELDREQTCVLERDGVRRRGDASAWLDPSLHPRWLRLTRLLAACRQRNLANGATIELQGRHVERVLAILHGIDDAPPLYGSRGEKRVINRSRYAATA